MWLASNQLVHASGGKPDPCSKDGAQVGGAVDVVERALEQGDLTFPVLSTDGGRASNEPESIDPELGLRKSALSHEPEAITTLPKIDGDQRTVKGRWRQTVPTSWKTPVISTEPE